MSVTAEFNQSHKSFEEQSEKRNQGTEKKNGGLSAVHQTDSNFCFEKNKEGCVLLAYTYSSILKQAGTVGEIIQVKLQALHFLGF